MNAIFCDTTAIPNNLRNECLSGVFKVRVTQKDYTIFFKQKSAASNMVCMITVIIGNFA